jgi:hypothetical protein
MEGLYTAEDIVRYITMCVITLTVLAPIAIAGWTFVVWVALKTIGIKPRETYSGISKNKVILTSVFMLSTAYIMGSVFQRFV